MALSGVRDTKSLVMLTGWDATALQNFRLQDGTTYRQVVAELNAALGALNVELRTDPLWSSLISFTDRPDTKYRVGSATNMEPFTEYGRGDASRAEREGHMLPLRKWDENLGWTWSYLKDGRNDEISMDIRNAIDAVRNRWRIQILTRLLKRGDDSGESKGLGTSGFSPGFATAAASTSVDFHPPDHGGVQFSTAHEHYVGIAGGTFTQASFQDAKAELREHGHEPPFEYIIGPSDETTVKGLTGFTPVAESLVAYGNLQDLARLDMRSTTQSGHYYIGTIEDFAVRVVPGMPQYYGFGWKSHGPLSSMNPLKIRLEKGKSTFECMAMTDPRSGAGGAYPLQELMLYVEFGVGVGDRTNGTPRYVNNATWADGTPT